MQQVLALDLDHVHAHSTLAQLAIRRQDWPLALQHAQHGLKVQSDDEPSAVLLATAYASRNAPGDLDNAIEHLQRFVRRYPGNPKAEDYLGKLSRRQVRDQSPARPALASAHAEPLAIEHDPLWRQFAASVQAASAPAAPADSLPLLASALRQAAAAG